MQSCTHIAEAGASEVQRQSSKQHRVFETSLGYGRHRLKKKNIPLLYLSTKIQHLPPFGASEKETGPDTHCCLMREGGIVLSCEPTGDPQASKLTVTHMALDNVLRTWNKSWMWEDLQGRTEVYRGGIRWGWNSFHTERGGGTEIQRATVKHQGSSKTPVEEQGLGLRKWEMSRTPQEDQQESTNHRAHREWSVKWTACKVWPRPLTDL